MCSGGAIHSLGDSWSFIRTWFLFIGCRCQIVEKPGPTHTSKPSFANPIDTFLSVDTKTWDWNRFSPTKDLESQQSRPSLASLRYHLFSIYRRLFTLVYIANAIAFIIIMVCSRRRHWPLSMRRGINLLPWPCSWSGMVVNSIFLDCVPCSVRPLFGYGKKLQRYLITVVYAVDAVSPLSCGTLGSLG